MKKHYCLALLCLLASFVAYAISGSDTSLFKDPASVTTKSVAGTSHIYLSSSKMASASQQTSEDSDSLSTNYLGKNWSYYHGDEELSSMGWSSTGTFSAGIIVSSKSGNKITAVEVPFFSGVSVSDVSVNVCTIDALNSYSGDEKYIMASKIMDEVRTGYYNLVVLDTPIEFPENGQLFVYYTLTIQKILDNGDNYPFVIFNPEEPIYGSLFSGRQLYNWNDDSVKGWASALSVYILPNISHEDIQDLLLDFESLSETPLISAYQTCTEYANALRVYDEYLLAGEEVDLEKLEIAYTNFETSLQELKLAIASYNNLCDKLTETKEYYTLNISTDFSVAYETVQGVITNIATLTSEEIIAAEQTFVLAIESFMAENRVTKVWDFDISEATIAALADDAYYYGSWGSYSNYYRNYSSGDWSQLSYRGSDGEQRIIPETEGLYFYNGGYNWRIYTDGTNRLYSYSSGSSYQFKIPDLVAGQIITINYTSGSDGSTRGIYRYSANTQVISGQETTTSTAEVQYEVTSDGDVYFYPYNGAIYINSISLTVPGDPMRLAEMRQKVAEYMATLDAFPGLKAELQETYDNAVITEEDTDVDSLITSLKDVLDNVKKAESLYPIILEDLVLADSVLTVGEYVDIAEAVALANALDVNTSWSSEYIAAFDVLETSLAIQHADQVAMSDWSFNTKTVITVDGLRYYLDTTNNLAEFIGFNSSNVQMKSLVIPATIRYNDATYCVVAMLNVNQYTQSNITSVVLPKSLRSIGDNAFWGYTNLTYLEIPENVTTIGSNIVCGDINLHAIKVNSVVPPTISSLWSGSYYYNGTYYYDNKIKITIPVESFHAYRITNVWKDNILIGGDGVTVSTGKIVAGDLGHIVLDEATYLQEVNKLIIDEGTLNNDDWNTIKSMTNLIEIDMSGVTMSSLPANAFDGRWAIESVKLPHNVISIGNYALRGTGIKEIKLPETLTTLGTSAFNNCDSIRTVSIPEAITRIPYDCFNDCNNLRKVELPSALTSVDQYAFSNCNALSDVTLPSSLTSIGSYAFRYCPIKSIDIPAGITAINNYSFADNSALDSLFIPKTVTTINSNAFYNCSYLKNVQFSEGLVNLYSNAFYNCKQLSEIVLPSSLEKCESAPFYGCSGVKKVEARSVIPPTTSGSCPLSNVNLNDVVLYVPSWSTSEYPLADGWSSFYTIEVSDFMPQYIKVNKDFYFTMRDTLAADYRPNIEMRYSDVESTDAYGHTNYERGNLTISGRSKLAVNNFSIVVSPFAKYYADENVRYNYTYDYYRTDLNSTSLIVNGEMRAENVTMRLNNYNSRWQFVTFPFDVKVSDIVPQKDNISWVIRGHNSAMRAAGKVDSVWVNLSADDILEAGKGYIMHNYNPDYINSWFWVYPLKNSVNRQLIFSAEDRTIELEEHLAEFDHNRSWNLIGNPYPCFYDSRFIDFDAPFMVWDSYSQNYVAYNPADDAYILSPGEAFFVQRPFEQESITFRKEGRQTHRYAREMDVENAPAGRNAETSDKPVRIVNNIVITKDSLSDRTRVVFNEMASLSYEMSKDATKFASSESSVPQIFTISDKTRYAINERPYQNGDVQLGVYCGSDGDYTISLSKSSSSSVLLEDKQNNVVTEISGGNGYTFYAAGGEYLNRFVLHFENGETGISSIESDKQGAAGEAYTLQGVKVSSSENNGIIIKNGLKTINK